MTRTEILDRLAAINIWSKGSQHAPHKPLLLLMAPGPLQPWGAARDPVQGRRHEVGRPVARVRAGALAPRKGHTDPLKSQLL